MSQNPSQNRGLVLASRSAARRAVLAAAGIAFEVETASVDEAALKRDRPHDTPRQIARALADAKAQDVSARRPGLVLGADQTLDLDGALFDKPDSLDAVREQLLALRGRSHVLHSGLALAEGGEVVWRGEAQARLTVRAFSDGFLDAYLTAEGEAVQACVGGYRLEGLGAQLFERIEGDYFTVLGLPLLLLLDELRARGLARS